MATAITTAARVARTQRIERVDDFAFVPTPTGDAVAQDADAQMRLQSALVCAGLAGLLK